MNLNYLFQTTFVTDIRQLLTPISTICFYRRMWGSRNLYQGVQRIILFAKVGGPRLFSVTLLGKFKEVLIFIVGDWTPLSLPLKFLIRARDIWNAKYIYTVTYNFQIMRLIFEYTCKRYFRWRRWGCKRIKTMTQAAMNTSYTQYSGGWKFAHQNSAPRLNRIKEV